MKHLRSLPRRFPGIPAPVVITVLASAWTLASAKAAVSYAGATYTQNFNMLPSGGTFTHTGAGPHELSASPINASGMSGWSFTKSGGSGSNALFKQATGSDNQGHGVQVRLQPNAQ